MKFNAAFSYLILSTAAAIAATAVPAAAASEHTEPSTQPARKRALRTNKDLAEGVDEAVSVLRAPVDAPVVSTLSAVGAGDVGDSSTNTNGIMTPQEEDDMRLLRLNDAVYWKKFLGNDDRSMPTAAPTFEGCNFDVDIGCNIKFAGGGEYRDCDDAFVCADDITEQKLRYLGGGCTTNEPSARNYECRIYDDGPSATQRVRIMVVYGDWWDALTSGKAANYGKAKERLNDLTDGRLDLITVFDTRNIDPGQIYRLLDLGDPLGAPDDVDTDDLTYVVFENGGDEGKLLLKATWEWKCDGKNAGRYSIFDDFGSSELVGFKSEAYGYTEPQMLKDSTAKNPSAQVKLTTTLDNKCRGADGMVVHLDRRFCFRDVGESAYTCEPLTTTPAKLCVDQAQFAQPDAQCTADGPLANEGTNMVPLLLKGKEDITFTDTMYTTFDIMENREFQYRVPNATVYFKTGNGEVVSNLNTREEWFFGGGSGAAPTPSPECDFDISNLSCEVTFNNGIYRQCQDAWKCTDDMDLTSLDFRYLGGNCRDEDFDNDVQYGCRTYDGGPGDGNRRVEIYQGNWYSFIDDNDSVNQVRSKITDALPGGCDFDDVLYFDRRNVSPGDQIGPDPNRPTNPACLNQRDRQYITYVVYENNSNLDQAEVRMKTRWIWDCTVTGGDFFPMESQYSAFDEFGNMQLIRFESSRYGVVEEGIQKARFEYTFQNECSLQGDIFNFDRQLCQRLCDDRDEGFSCPPRAPPRKNGCVMDSRAMTPCDGDTALPGGNRPNTRTTTISDFYDNIQIGPNFEYQIRLLDTVVRWGSTRETKPRVDSSVFSFCEEEGRVVSDPTTASTATTATTGGSESKSGKSGKSGRFLADSRGKLAFDNGKKMSRKQPRRGRATNEWEADDHFF